MLYKKIPAFSIVEKVIAISLSGLMVGIGIFGYNKIVKSSYQHISIDRVNTIKQALDSYYIKNNRLPCPAGFSSGDSSNEDCNKATEFNTQSGNANVVMLYGKVPSSTLNITNEMENDGYGNMISYFVVKQFTQNNIRYYKNHNNPIEFMTNENLQDIQFQDTIIADSYNISTNNLGNETSDDIVYFMKILSPKTTSFPSNTRSNLINSYTNSTTSSQDNGKVVSLNAIFVVVSHGKDGYCGRNIKNNYEINQIPDDILNDPNFYYNDYINCVNYISPSAGSDNSRAFVFNSNTNSMSKYNNDIVAFSNFKSFYQSFLNNNKIDCVGQTKQSIAEEYISEIKYSRDITYIFNRTKSSKTIIQPHSIITDPINTDNNNCGFMTLNKYPMSNPSAVCNNGDWTNFVPLTCGNENSLQLSLY